MEDYTFEVNSIISFLKKKERLPYYFSNNAYEVNLNKIMYNIIYLYRNNYISDNQLGDLKMISEKYNLNEEIDYNLNTIINLLENEYTYNTICKEYKYLEDFIEFIQENKYILDINRFISFSKLPLWEWKYDVSINMIDKLYYFCQYKECMPKFNKYDIDETILYNFVNTIYYYYVYEKLPLNINEELSSIKYFSFNDYKKSNITFLQRYCIENNVYNKYNNFLTFQSNFNKIFEFYRINKQVPSLNDEEYVYCLNIKKMYYDKNISFLQVNTMNELKGWSWDLTIKIINEYGNDKINNNNLLDNYLKSIIKNNYYYSVRKDYNYPSNSNIKYIRIKINKGKINKKYRISKNICKLRLKIMNNYNF